MQRPIKFRAWDSFKNQMIYQHQLEEDSIFCFFDFLEKYRQQITFLQYTGLHDKNGREVYEGDILNVVGYPSKVSFNIKTGAFCVETNNGQSDHLYAAEMVEIIGNIYENPELLTKEGL